jgi:hypothetical protein
MLADAVLVLHLVVVLFITAGLPLIYLGAARGWAWVRNRRWRTLHLAAIVFVAAESVLGIACPLTVWEDALRGHRAGTDFIARALGRILFYEFPAWVFVAAYVGFAVLVALACLSVPPLRPGAARRAR